MISSKRLAQHLIKELEGGMSPRALAERLKVLSAHVAVRDIMPNVITYLERYAKRKELEGSFQIETANAVGESLVQKLRKTLKAEDDLPTHANIKKELVGGFRIKKGDRFIDDSIALRLQKIRESLRA